MKWLANLFRHLWADLTSPKAIAIEQQIETLVVAAQPIVSTIAVLVPNKTVQEVSKAYNQFGVPLVKEIADDPTSIGNAMMNLAVAVLQKNHQDAAVSTLNTAVNLAVTALKIILASTSGA